ncbi:MAG: Type IV pilus biogenesis protein PilM [Candidatus Giovannonibacteria bacterium GW2011_GWB1_43_13]|uniref:Type IV pilus biogenesis protein PilM n=1 Tax=Candidatus Giovannonibacteria bacterium GW2011_GWA2_44_26 TaxID=1618648 RepID=A0A0G1IS51_9BACT|nr:MAG: Type IV pilus biogenesis protein PilM [Candidatus Giovannonibacteria bacterium GW2011_GWB1_43_13]KKT62221.1 MAG: Type IV pilus biogenesis protein PilM [Candidatus Giovannonibacteria bacterium GW2011_GWA2_44_26]
MELKSLLERFSWKKASAFLNKESRFLGVDIGSSSIKLAQLKKDKERAVLETYGELALAKYGEGAVGRSVRLVDTKLAEALKDLLAEAQVKAKEAVVSIPLKDSFLTTMDMPEMGEEEMKESVPYEARKYIPIPISEVTMDWWTLPPGGKEQSATSIGSGRRKFRTVILAAVPKETISKYKNIFEKAGLKISAFEIEVFSFARAVLRHDLGTALMMDLGASAIKMVIADGGVVRASHGFDRGSQELTLALSQSLGVDWDRAEVLKRASGIIKKPETEGIASVLEPTVELWASEGERFLLDWKRRGGRSISKLIIGGGGAMLQGAGDLFVKKFGVEVMIANPFSKVVYPAFLEPALKEVGVTFTNAVGLALRNF